MEEMKTIEKQEETNIEEEQEINTTIYINCYFNKNKYDELINCINEESENKEDIQKEKYKRRYCISKYQENKYIR
ncbi:hypothetical protein ENUP19_0083G0077 [Entamoeba nuttalli]|uniref:Uncharacterized protein n=1 Tax=Entamoeba nuttalli TaxID=412467 RepID=A0ABQ0DFS6_9EUKA